MSEYKVSFVDDDGDEVSFCRAPNDEHVVVQIGQECVSIPYGTFWAMANQITSCIFQEDFDAEEDEINE